MKIKIYKKPILLLLFLSLAIPLISYAVEPCIIAGAPCITSFNVILEVILQIVWVVFTVIVVISFVTAGVLFLTAQGNPEKLRIARAAVIWGIAGVIVGILAYGIIRIVGSVLT